MPHAPLFPNATLVQFYRLSLLLTGHARDAERALAETLREAETKIADVRDEQRRRSWVVSRLRQSCVPTPDPTARGGEAPRLVRSENGSEELPEVLPIEAYILAQRFGALPDPERSALAIFYLDLFSCEEIAQLLGMTLEQLAETLAKARSRLRASLHTSDATNGPGR